LVQVQIQEKTMCLQPISQKSGALEQALHLQPKA
jgi:hypothetical protein